MRKIITLLSIGLLMFSLPGYSQPPDFTMVSSQGETYNLHDELDAGKTVILNFFSVTCGSCQLGVPALEKAWNEHLKNGQNGWVWGIEVSYRDDEAINDFLDEYGGSYPGFSIIDDDSVYNEPYGYDVPYTPHYYMVCPDYDVRLFPLDEIDRYLENCGVELGTADVSQSFEVYASGNQIILEDVPVSNYAYQIKIVDMQGKIVFADGFAPGKRTFEVSEPLLDGIYLVSLFDGHDLAFSEKVIVR